MICCGAVRAGKTVKGFWLFKTDTSLLALFSCILPISFSTLLMSSGRFPWSLRIGFCNLQFQLILQWGFQHFSFLESEFFSSLDCEVNGYRHVFYPKPHLIKSLSDEIFLKRLTLFKLRHTIQNLGSLAPFNYGECRGMKSFSFG